ncbi:MAG TPA: ATP-binding cassette domain-containing protein, partial [Roseiarcus sp.]|nr:ATP-binding cassette domain-containing protein [Roseiarcus sp.]
MSKSFGGLVVAREINFDLAPGDRKALIGPNGAGKSTFANLLTG